MDANELAQRESELNTCKQELFEMYQANIHAFCRETSQVTDALSKAGHHFASAALAVAGMDVIFKAWLIDAEKEENKGTQ